MSLAEYDEVVSVNFTHVARDYSTHTMLFYNSIREYDLSRSRAQEPEKSNSGAGHIFLVRHLFTKIVLLQGKLDFLFQINYGNNCNTFFILFAEQHKIT